MRYLFFLSVLILVQIKAYAFPEMIRHGYVNCMACHTTQSGGDMLSPYGKELSKEILSRNDSVFKTNAKGEKNYWKIETPEWLRVGSDVRFLQTFSESSAASRGRFMIMQVDIDALFQVSENVHVYSSIGRFEPSKPEAEWKDFIYTPRLWAQYSTNWNDGMQTAALRVGRFYPSYGVNVPEHTYVNRRYLDLNPGQERLAAEASWSSESYQVVATGIAQRARFDQYDEENGYVLQASKVFGDKARAGVNIYRSKLKSGGKETDRAFEGVFALIGWTHEISMLFQADRIYNPNGKTGFVNFMKLGYEYTHGVQLFATQEYYNADTENTDPHLESYGVGVQYFPVPNVDLFATFKKTKDSATLREFQNVVWLIAHFYL